MGRQSSIRELNHRSNLGNRLKNMIVRVCLRITATNNSHLRELLPYQVKSRRRIYAEQVNRRSDIFHQLTRDAVQEYPAEAPMVM